METSEKEFDRDALIQELRGEIARLKARIVELEKKNPTKRLDASYSMRAEEERQAKAKPVRKPRSRSVAGGGRIARRSTWPIGSS